jgi:hypothetical protein
MNPPYREASPNLPRLTNGSGAAAILAAAIGCFALAVLAIAGDKSAVIKNVLVFYSPTGVLSGVTTVAILTWLLTWAVLDLRWRKKTIPLAKIIRVAFALLLLSFLLTIPPIADLF